jgi:hypothetical protein
MPIGELSRLCGVNIETIRYYEKIKMVIGLKAEKAQLTAYSQSTSRTKRKKECVMRGLLFVSGAFLLLVAAPARADRPVTDDERAKLLPAIAAEGCSGGKLEFDDGKYEVNDAICNDGRTYELKFDAGFRLIKKELED